MQKMKIGVGLMVLTIITAFWITWRPAKKFTPEKLSDDRFRVVTWNVGYFTFLKDKNLRNSDLSYVAETLLKTDASVIILQELGNLSQAQEIAKQLGEEWAAYSTSTGHGEQVVSILTTLPKQFEEVVPCGIRNAKGLSVQHPNGSSLYILAMHAAHPIHGLHNTKKNISDAFEHVSKRKEKIRLFGGDLNYNFDPKNAGGFYSKVTRGFGDGTVDIGETYYAHTRIDHLFHSPKDLHIVESECGLLPLKTKFTKVPGFRDHRPIVVTYTLN